MNGSKSRRLTWALLIVAGLIGLAIVCTFAAFAGAGSLFWTILRRSSAPDKVLSNAELKGLTRSTDPRQAHIQYSKGIVEVSGENGEWMPAAQDQLVSAGNSIRTGALSNAVFAFADGSQFTLEPETEIAIQQLDYSGGLQTIVMEQQTGVSSHRVASSSGGKISYTVLTPNSRLLADGTIFSVSVGESLGTRVTVDDGSVTAEGNGESVQVNAGQVTTIAGDDPPSAPSPRISGEGAVSEMGEKWVIAGQPFTTHRETQIIGEPNVGDLVHFEGRLLPDNTRIADLIYLLRPSPANNFTLTGKVDTIGADAWEIGGQTVLITTTTQLDPGIKSGNTVQAEGIILENGGLLANGIHLYDTQEGLPFVFSGVVGETGSTWTISGVKIKINNNTVIAEGVGVGDVVQVSGTIQPNGPWIASQIVPAKLGRQRFEISGRLESLNPWRVAGITFETRDWTEVQQGLKAGDYVHVTGVIQDDGTWVAYEISRVEETPYPLMIIIGKIISVDPLVVSGIPLDVTNETTIEGELSPGMLVRVEIYLLPDGNWQVVRITPLDVFTGIPGCMDVTATVVSVDGNILQLLGWSKLEMDEDIHVEGDLRRNSIVLVKLCFDNEGHLTILLISPIFQPDEEGEPADQGDKVTICHKPFKKKGGNTITVARPALPAHLGHGDYIGACSR